MSAWILPRAKFWHRGFGDFYRCVMAKSRRIAAETQSRDESFQNTEHSK